MKYIVLFFKGFLIGIAKIIPGVSGAMLAISLGVYERAMQAISSFFIDAKENFKFLFPLGLGAVIAIILTSNIILFFLTNYYLSTLLLFIGLICGGIPDLFKEISIKKNNGFILIVSFLLVVGLSFIGKQSIFIDSNNSIFQFILYFFIGVIDCLTMIVPGISGTAIMMLLGCYDSLLYLLGSLGSIDLMIKNLCLIIPFILGIVTTIMLLAKLMTYLFKNKKNQTYLSIIGFSIGSIILLLNDALKIQNITNDVVISILLFIIGFFIAYKLSKKET